MMPAHQAHPAAADTALLMALTACNAGAHATFCIVHRTATNHTTTTFPTSTGLTTIIVTNSNSTREA